MFKNKSILLILLLNLSFYSLYAGSISKITNIIKSHGNYSVSLFENDDFANDNSKKIEIIINATYSYSDNIYSFEQAKHKMYDIMKDLYTDSSINYKIARVVFNSHFLRCSLGSKDGIELTRGDAWGGATNFWNVMMQFKPYEAEYGNINSRTWAVQIKK